jgi:hypothetical protein
MTLTHRFPDIREPVVQTGDTIADQEAADKSVGEPDQAADARHPVSDEELTQEGEVWSYNLPRLPFAPLPRSNFLLESHYAVGCSAETY